MYTLEAIKFKERVPSGYLEGWVGWIKEWIDDYPVIAVSSGVICPTAEEALEIARQKLFALLHKIKAPGSWRTSQALDNKNIHERTICVYPVTIY